MGLFSFLFERTHYFVFKYYLMKIVKNFSPKNIKAVASSSGVVKYELLDLDVYTDILDDLVLDLPFRFFCVKIRKLAVTIPVPKILSQEMELEVEGVQISLIPTPETESSMCHSKKRQEDTRKRSSIDLADEKLFEVSGVVDDAMNVKVKDGGDDDDGSDFEDLNDEQEAPDERSGSTENQERSKAIKKGVAYLKHIFKKILNSTDITIRDVTLELIDPGRPVRLRLNLPEMTYRDTESEKPTGVNAGDDPIFYKALRFQGFRLELINDDPEQYDRPLSRVIAHSNSSLLFSKQGQKLREDNSRKLREGNGESVIKLRLDTRSDSNRGGRRIPNMSESMSAASMSASSLERQVSATDSIPRLDARCFVNSFAVLISPREIEDILHLTDALSKSNEFVVMHATEKDAHSQDDNDFGLVGSERRKQRRNSSSLSSHKAPPPSTSGDGDDSPSLFWSMQINLREVSLIFPEEYAFEWPENWYLSKLNSVENPGRLGGSDEISRGCLSRAAVPRFTTNHILCVFKNVHFGAQQTQARGLSRLDIPMMEVFEFTQPTSTFSHPEKLIQRRLLEFPEATSEILMFDSMAASFTAGIGTASMMASSRVASSAGHGMRLEEPQFRFQSLQLVPKGNADRALDPETYAQQIEIRLRPIFLELDLGFYNRLQPLISAFSGEALPSPSPVSHTNSNHPPPSSHSHSRAHDFPHSSGSDHFSSSHSPDHLSPDPNIPSHHHSRTSDSSPLPPPNITLTAEKIQFRLCFPMSVVNSDASPGSGSGSGSGDKGKSNLDSAAMGSTLLDASLMASTFEGDCRGPLRTEHLLIETNGFRLNTLSTSSAPLSSLPSEEPLSSRPTSAGSSGGGGGASWEFQGEDFAVDLVVDGSRGELFDSSASVFDSTIIPTDSPPAPLSTAAQRPHPKSDSILLSPPLDNAHFPNSRLSHGVHSNPLPGAGGRPSGRHRSMQDSTLFDDYKHDRGPEDSFLSGFPTSSLVRRNVLHALSDEVFDEVTGKHERILPRACIFPKSSDARPESRDGQDDDPGLPSTKHWWEPSAEELAKKKSPFSWRSGGDGGSGDGMHSREDDEEDVFSGGGYFGGDTEGDDDPDGVRNERFYHRAQSVAPSHMYYDLPKIYANLSNEDFSILMMLYVEFLNAFGRNTTEASAAENPAAAAEEKSPLSDVQLDADSSLSRSKHRGGQSSRADSDFSDPEGSDSDADEDVSMFYSVIEKPISPASSMAELPQVQGLTVVDVNLSEADALDLKMRESFVSIAPTEQSAADSAPHRKDPDMPLFSALKSPPSQILTSLKIKVREGTLNVFESEQKLEKLKRDAAFEAMSASSIFMDGVNLKDAGRRTKTARVDDASLERAAQTFQINLQDLCLRHVVRLEPRKLPGLEESLMSAFSNSQSPSAEEDPEERRMRKFYFSPTTYVMASSGDAVLSEFLGLLKRYHRYYDYSPEADEVRCIPLLFRTLVPQDAFSAKTDVFRAHIKIDMKRSFETKNFDDTGFMSVDARVDLRAMTYKYRPDSEWLGRIIDCFTWDIADHNPPGGTTRRGSDVSDTESKDGDAAAAAATGVAAADDGETMKDEVLLFLRSYKTVLDYNPEDIPARFVAELDNVKVIVSLVAESPQLGYKIECSDAGLFLTDYADKFSAAPLRDIVIRTESGGGYSQFPVFKSPLIHHAPGMSLMPYLEARNHVRVLSLDHFELEVKQATETEHACFSVTGGTAHFTVCADSFVTVQDIINHLQLELNGLATVPSDTQAVVAAGDAHSESSGGSVYDDVDTGVRAVYGATAFGTAPGPEAGRGDSDKLLSLRRQEKLPSNVRIQGPFLEDDEHAARPHQNSDDRAPSPVFDMEEESPSINAGGPLPRVDDEPFDLFRGVDMNAFSARPGDDREESASHRLASVPQDLVALAGSSAPSHRGDAGDGASRMRSSSTGVGRTHIIDDFHAGSLREHTQRQRNANLPSERIARNLFDMSLTRARGQTGQNLAGSGSAESDHAHSSPRSDDRRAAWNMDQVDVEPTDNQGIWYPEPLVDESNMDLPEARSGRSDTTQSLRKSTLGSESERQQQSNMLSSMLSTETAKSVFSGAQFFENYVDDKAKAITGPFTEALPPHFPMPVMKTVVKLKKLHWSAYGGRDYDTPEERRARKLRERAARRMRERSRGGANLAFPQHEDTLPLGADSLSQQVRRFTDAHAHQSSSAASRPSSLLSRRSLNDHLRDRVAAPDSSHSTSSRSLSRTSQQQQQQQHSRSVRFQSPSPIHPQAHGPLSALSSTGGGGGKSVDNFRQHYFGSVNSDDEKSPALAPIAGAIEIAAPGGGSGRSRQRRGSRGVSDEFDNWSDTRSVRSHRSGASAPSPSPGLDAFIRGPSSPKSSARSLEKFYAAPGEQSLYMPMSGGGGGFGGGFGGGPVSQPPDATDRGAAGVGARPGSYGSDASHASRKSSSVGGGGSGATSSRSAKGRRPKETIVFLFEGLSVFSHSFQENETYSSRFILQSTGLELLDKVDASNFKKLGCEYRRYARKTHDKMLKLSMVNVRPDVEREPLREDLRVRIELLPTRLNVDQVTLRHFLAFFSGPEEAEAADAEANTSSQSKKHAAESSTHSSRRNSGSTRNKSRGRSNERPASALSMPHNASGAAGGDRGGRRQHVSPSLSSAPAHRPHSAVVSASSSSRSHRRSNSNSRTSRPPSIPPFTAPEHFASMDPFAAAEQRGHSRERDRRSRSRSGSLSRGDADRPPSRGRRYTRADAESDTDDDELVERQFPKKEEPPLVYIQSFNVNEIPILIDYKPRYVDLEQLKDGDYSQILHLFPLMDVELDLKRFEAHGVKGWGAALGLMFAYWGEQIAKHQVHRYFLGIQPIRSFYNIGGGFADLFLVPMRQYQKDGRIARGLMDGTTRFGRTLAVETIQLTNKFTELIQQCLEAVDFMIQPPQSDAANAATIRGRYRSSRRVGARITRQPRSVGEGLTQAYQSISLSMQAAANGIAVIPQENYRRAGNSYSQYLTSLVRGVPGAVLQPMIGVTEALSKALIGARNEISPTRRLEMEDKYKAGAGRSGHK